MPQPVQQLQGLLTGGSRSRSPSNLDLTSAALALEEQQAALKMARLRAKFQADMERAEAKAGPIARGAEGISTAITEGVQEELRRRNRLEDQESIAKMQAKVSMDTEKTMAGFRRKESQAAADIARRSEESLLETKTRTEKDVYLWKEKMDTRAAQVDAAEQARLEAAAVRNARLVADASATEKLAQEQYEVTTDLLTAALENGSIDFAKYQDLTHQAINARGVAGAMTRADVANLNEIHAKVKGDILAHMGQVRSDVDLQSPTFDADLQKVLDDVNPRPEAGPGPEGPLSEEQRAYLEENGPAPMGLYPGIMDSAMGPFVVDSARRTIPGLMLTDKTLRLMNDPSKKREYVAMALGQSVRLMSTARDFNELANEVGDFAQKRMGGAIPEATSSMRDTIIRKATDASMVGGKYGYKEVARDLLSAITGRVFPVQGDGESNTTMRDLSSSFLDRTLEFKTPDELMRAVALRESYRAFLMETLPVEEGSMAGALVSARLAAGIKEWLRDPIGGKAVRQALGVDEDGVFKDATTTMETDDKIRLVIEHMRAEASLGARRITQHMPLIKAANQFRDGPVGVSVLNEVEGRIEAVELDIAKTVINGQLNNLDSDELQKRLEFKLGQEYEDAFSTMSALKKLIGGGWMDKVMGPPEVPAVPWSDYGRTVRYTVGGPLQQTEPAGPPPPPMTAGEPQQPGVPPAAQSVSTVDPATMQPATMGQYQDDRRFVPEGGQQ